MGLGKTHPLTPLMKAKAIRVQHSNRKTLSEETT